VADRKGCPEERYGKLIVQLIEQTPLNEEAGQDYHADTELVQERNYKVEMQLRKLKRCSSYSQVISPGAFAR
jgi:hypothetical protein